MAMEYVEGDSLETLIRKAGALSPAVAAEITRQGLEGLAHAHRKGILHRDIKPANLMLTPEGAIKLMDFGIARVIGEQRLTQVNRVVGTLEYMAPELIQGEAPSPASDIYAMGILLYELLSGKLPFASRTDYELMQAIIREKPIALRKLNGQIPKELEAIVQKSLDKNPAKRFADAKEFQRALQPYFSQILVLNPAQLMALPPTQDILDIQPTRQTRLAETKVAPASQRPFANIGWVSENWQMLLAGVLIVLAMLFMGLILFDKATDTHPVTQHTQLAGNHPRVAAKQLQTAKDESVTMVAASGETPAPAPVEVIPAPVEKKPVGIETKPKSVAPRSPGTPTPIIRKPGIATPQTPKQKPVDEPIPQPTQPTRTEPISEPIMPKTTARKSIAIHRLPVTLTLTDGLSSDVAQEGQTLHFRVAESVMSNGQVVIQAGAMAYGEVSRVKRADGEMFRRKSLLEFRIHSVEAVNGKRLSLRSATISDEAKGQPVVFRSGQTFEVRTGDELIDL